MDGHYQEKPLGDYSLSIPEDHLLSIKGSAKWQIIRNLFSSNLFLFESNKSELIWPWNGFCIKIFDGIEGFIEVGGGF